MLVISNCVSIDWYYFMLKSYCKCYVLSSLWCIRCLVQLLIVRFLFIFDLYALLLNVYSSASLFHYATMSATIHIVVQFYKIFSFICGHGIGGVMALWD